MTSPRPARLTPQAVRSVLEQGQISLQGQFIPGSNSTFLVSVDHAGLDIPAVYKPMRGEQPLWDFPFASLAGREVAAYLVSTAAGFNFVPSTVFCEGPYGPGSLQQYIEYNPGEHYFNFKPKDTSRLRPVALFDLLVNNADRKGSHVFFQKYTRTLYAIDHGLCFHAEDKLRTVIWDFAGEPFPADLLEKLASLQAQANQLPPLLSPCLLPEEIAAFQARLTALLAHPFYPSPPPDRRAFPYPPL